MAGIRRALVWSTTEKYFTLVVNFLAIAVISRLLRPEEIGVSAVGTAIIGFALAVRELVSSGYLIQQANLTRESVRTLFTLLFGFSLIVAAILIQGAPLAASFFGAADLAFYLQLLAVALVIEAFFLPITALLRREMAFGTLAAINISVAAVCAPLSIVLAALGFSYLSLAWAWLCTSALTAVAALFARPMFWIYRPSLKSWRSVLAFGSFGGTNTLLLWMYETLPQLVLGRVLPLDDVGRYSRAMLICSIPDKVVLTGVSSVATPALAAQVRDGRCIQQAYLRSLGLITVVHWPALVTLVVLAKPAVELALGEQWLGIVLVVQLLAGASLFRFPSILSSSVLIAVGAIHHTLRASIVTLPLSALLLCLASPFGIQAMAATQLLAVPFQSFVVLQLVRRHLPFEWREFVAALRPSAVVAGFTAAGAVAANLMSGVASDLSIPEAVVSVLMAAMGWGVGILVSNHPARDEFQHVVAAADVVISRWVGRPVFHSGGRPEGVGEVDAKS